MARKKKEKDALPLGAWVETWNLAPPEPKPSELHLEYHESRYGGEICEGQENDPWPSHEDEYIEFNLIRAVKNKREAAWLREVVNLDFDPPVGSYVFVVVVRYGTGCTFGHTNGAWMIQGVYPTLEQAAQVRQSIEDDTYEGYSPWRGYFESLEGVEIESMRIDG